MEEIIEKYIALRDKKSEMAAAYKEQVAKIDEVLGKLEGALLLKLEDNGMESARCKSGTVFKSTRSSATVADWDFALDFIQNNKMWNMLERRVNKQAVQQYREEHGDLPPGVNWREEVVVNIRRS